MDLISTAKARLAALDAERNKLLQFISIGEELKSGAMHLPHAVAQPNSATMKVTSTTSRIRARKPPRAGAIYDTAMVCINYMKEHGEGIKTRDLLPIVEAAGIEVGGVNPIATLSARLGTSQLFDRRGAKLFIRNEPDEETADTTTKEESAASNHDNRGGGD